MKGILLMSQHIWGIINLGDLSIALMNSLHAYYAYGSGYVTSLHKLAETGQTLTVLSQNPECE